jgi:hypothetical protein
LGSKKFGSKNFLGQTYFWVKKKFGSKKISGQKNFRSKKNFGSKQFSGQQFFGPQFFLVKHFFPYGFGEKFKGDFAKIVDLFQH